MPAGLSTRRYPVGLEPVGQKVERAARCTSKSTVTRRFVAATETALGEPPARDAANGRVRCPGSVRHAGKRVRRGIHRGGGCLFEENAMDINSAGVTRDEILIHAPIEAIWDIKADVLSSSLVS